MSVYKFGCGFNRLEMIVPQLQFLAVMI